MPRVAHRSTPLSLTDTGAWVARATLTLLVATVLAAIGLVVTPSPAAAAERGVGFGTWAPTSAYGWHGSMVVDGVHTYCILPGRPLPVGATTDHGERTRVAGLSPADLAGINHLVTRYGQTDDPVQAAAVGWAVKAIADWDATLHTFGYRGDTLAGAIDWTFSALAPAHNRAVQRLAVAYYREATGVADGAGGTDLTLTVTTDPEDPSRGTVTVTGSPGLQGSLTLANARFADTGEATRSDVATGSTFDIDAVGGTPGRGFRVDVTGAFVQPMPTAIRHYTTAGGQDTAGPAAPRAVTAGAQDDAERTLRFSPTISTQVAAAYAAGGAYVDDVSLTGDLVHWPRDDAGTFLPVTASADLFRTATPPAPADGAPASAVHVGVLALTTGADGPDATYRVSGPEMTEPGFYTAVWRIDADAQETDVARALPAGYRWTETFGAPSQITMVADIASQAQPQIQAGQSASDTILVGEPLPAGGLVVSSALYRAADGVSAVDTCTPERRVYESEGISIDAPGDYAVTPGPLPDAGTYYWQERAVDAEGALVHLGECGVAEETTLVTAAAAPETAPAAPSTPELAATGADIADLRTVAGTAVGLIFAGATLIAVPARRRFGSAARVG